MRSSWQSIRFIGETDSTPRWRAWCRCSAPRFRTMPICYQLLGGSRLRCHLYLAGSEASESGAVCLAGRCSELKQQWLTHERLAGLVMGYRSSASAMRAGFASSDSSAITHMVLLIAYSRFRQTGLHETVYRLRRPQSIFNGSFNPAECLYKLSVFNVDACFSKLVLVKIRK
jgi:hypothetical protein